jgi:hypothetical protein
MVKALAMIDHLSLLGRNISAATGQGKTELRQLLKLIRLLLSDIGTGTEGDLSNYRQ